MRTRTTSVSEDMPAIAGHLERLIETERRLDRALAEARLDAEQIVARARAEANARASDLALDLVRTKKTLEEAHAHRHRAEAEAMEARGREDAAKFDDAPADLIDQLAEFVVDCVVAGAVQETKP